LENLDQKATDMNGLKLMLHVIKTLAEIMQYKMDHAKSQNVTHCTICDKTTWSQVNQTKLQL